MRQKGTHNPLVASSTRARLTSEAIYTFRGPRSHDSERYDWLAFDVSPRHSADTDLANYYTDLPAMWSFGWTSTNIWM